MENSFNYNNKNKSNEVEEEIFYEAQDDIEIINVTNNFNQSENINIRQDYNKNISYNKEANESLNPSKILNFTENYANNNRLKDIINYLKVQKQPFDEQDLAKIFDRLDVDNDGKISHDEIKAFLNTLKTPVNDFYIEKIIKEFDRNNSGDIEKHEFLMKMGGNRVNKNNLTELVEIFKLFDANHDNYICSQDLSNIMKALGENFDDEKCAAMMKVLEDRNGKINFQQFFDLVKDEGKQEFID